MDTTMICGTLKDGATRQEAAVLRALARAYAEGTHARLVYAKDLGGIVLGLCNGARDEQYVVQPRSCSCLAGQDYMFYKHIAALLDVVGRLDLIVPDFYERFVPPMDSAAA